MGRHRAVSGFESPKYLSETIDDHLLNELEYSLCGKTINILQFLLKPHNFVIVNNLNHLLFSFLSSEHLAHQLVSRDNTVYETFRKITSFIIELYLTLKPSGQWDSGN